MNPFVPKMRKSKILRYFLDCVNVAAVAIMLAVLVSMTIESVVGWRSAVIAVLAVFFTFGPYKINAIKIIIGGAALGYLLNLI